MILALYVFWELIFSEEYALLWFDVGICRILPHSLVDEMTAVCLFVSDVDRNDRDFTISVDKYHELLDDADVKPQIDVSFSVLTTVNPLKCSGVRQLHLKVFNAIQV